MLDSWYELTTVFVYKWHICQMQERWMDDVDPEWHALNATIQVE